MPKVKQPNSSKFQNMLYEYATEFTSTRKGEIFCKFCDCLSRDEHGSGLKPISGGSGLDRTEKFLVV